MRLSVQNLGPIAEADVTFGDLTILVGPQATGKSIFLQTLKLVRDHDDIGRALNVHGYFWNSTSSTADYQELFYGEGLGKLWHDATSVKFNESPITLASIAFFAGDIEHVFDPAEESVLYVPAQRVALFRKGWPRPFSDFDDGGPFVLRDFSESLRRFSDYFVQYDEDEPLFETQLEGIVPTVYQQWEVSVDLSQKRRRYALKAAGHDVLPFSTWSSGQKEFLPIALAFTAYPRASESRDTIIIEEPEMGLHPKAIQAFLLLVLELIQNGYKVILSTHSPVVLEMAWALRFLQQGQATAADVAKLFEVEASADLLPLFERALTAETKVYYFDRRPEDGRVHARDISSLDAESDDPGIAGWGGLTDFVSRAGAVVSQVMARSL